MKLKEFAEQMNKLVDEGHGHKEVFYRRSSSGDCGALNGARITDEVGEAGPFDLEEGEEYVSVSAGN